MSEFTRSRFESEARRLRPGLLRVATSITGNPDDASDIVQETLLKLWFLLPNLHEYKAVDAPARVIVRNLSLNHIRDRHTCPLDDAGLTDMAVEENDCEISDELLEIISSLPDTEQAVLRMKHIDGLETEEIAELIQSTPGAVRTALSRARRRIRDLYTKNR